MIYVQGNFTVLHYAADKGHAEIAEMLLNDPRFTEYNATENVSVMIPRYN